MSEGQNEASCEFCSLYLSKERTLFETRHFFVIHDKHPVTEGHALIISKAHKSDIFSLDREEWKNLQVALRHTKAWSEAKESNYAEAYNIGANCGSLAGQTIFHFHLHVFPRRAGDVPDPRGGIRNFKKPLIEY